MIRRPPRSTLFPLHDALPICATDTGDEPVPVGSRPPDVPASYLDAHDPARPRGGGALPGRRRDRKSTRLNSSHANISYAVFCLKKKNNPVHTYRDSVQELLKC